MSNAKPIGAVLAVHGRALAAAVFLNACASQAVVTPEPLSPVQASFPGAIADSVHESVVAAGVTHRTLWYAAGPWSVHIMEIDPQACGVDFRTVKALDRVVGRETTSSMAQRTATALGRPVLAAVNADFFNFEPPGLPEGPQVTAGVVVIGEDTRRAALESKQLDDQPVFAVTDTRQPVLGYSRLSGRIRLAAGVSVRLDRANALPPANGVAVYDQWWGDATPPDSGVVEAIVRRLNTPRAVGDTIRGVIIEIDTVVAGVAIANDNAVFAARGSAADALRHAAPGDTVAWYFTLPGIGERVVELVGGYPMLIEGGRDVHALPGILPSFANGRHPRAVIGIRDNGNVVIVVVDGRRPGFSVGLSLTELAAYVRTLGVRNALNLDGGGSTTLVLRGDIVNRPTDRDGERAVANALLVLGPVPGTCSEVRDASSTLDRGRPNAVSEQSVY